MMMVCENQLSDQRVAGWPLGAALPAPEEFKAGPPAGVLIELPLPARCAVSSELATRGAGPELSPPPSVVEKDQAELRAGDCRDEKGGRDDTGQTHGRTSRMGRDCATAPRQMGFFNTYMGMASGKSQA